MKNYRLSIFGLFNTALLIGVIFSLTACNFESQSAKKEPVFHLALLDSNKISWPKGNVYYTSETLWPLLKKAYPSAVAYRISDVDIESYDWTHQVITLTIEGSSKLLDTLACSGIEKIYPYFCLDKYQFVVVLDDGVIYGGDFSEIGSAMARQYPTINISGANGKMMFSIRNPSNLSDIIKDERIKSIFSGLGKLIE